MEANAFAKKIQWQILGLTKQKFRIKWVVVGNRGKMDFNQWLANKTNWSDVICLHNCYNSK